MTRIRLHPLWPALLLLAAGALLLPREPLIIEAHDERLYHLPVIREFASELPRPDIRDYSAAMAPLYHVSMAVAVRAGLENIAALRLLSLAISALSLSALWWYFSGFATRSRAAMFAMAIGLSPYFLGPALYLSSDNLAFGAMAAALALANQGRAGLSAAATTVAVLTRQLYVWLIPLCAYAAWRDGRRARALAWLLLPAAALGGLVWIWGGPVPPSFAMHQEPVGLLPAMVIIGTLGVWAIPLLPSLAKEADGRRAAVLFALIASAAAVYLFFVPLDDMHPAPWGGGLRALGRYTGTLAGTPLTFWAGLIMGALALALMLARTLTPHHRTVLVTAGLWMLAQNSNAAMHERYYQPFLLLVLFSFVAPWRGGRTTAGIAVLIVMILLTSAVRFFVHGGGLYRF